MVYLTGLPQSPDTSYSERYITIFGRNRWVGGIVQASYAIPIILTFHGLLSAWLMPIAWLNSKRSIFIVLGLVAVFSVLCFLGFELNRSIEG